jgi:hypothetical protein
MKTVNFQICSNKLNSIGADQGTLQFNITKNKKRSYIQDSVGNEENGYPVPDLNKTTIDVTKELSDAHTHKKKTHKEEIWK